MLHVSFLAHHFNGRENPLGFPAKLVHVNVYEVCEERKRNIRVRVHLKGGLGWVGRTMNQGKQLLKPCVGL